MESLYISSKPNIYKPSREINKNTVLASDNKDYVVLIIEM